MRDLWKIAIHMLRRSWRMIWLIRIQFLIMFLLTLILSGILLKNEAHLHMLKNNIGDDAWLILPTIHNGTTSDLTWNEKQLEWLRKRFMGKIGLIDVIPAKADHPQVIYVNNVIKSYLYENGRNQTRTIELLKYFLTRLQIQPDVQVLPLDEKNHGDPWVFILGVDDGEIQINSLNSELSKLNPDFNYYVERVIQGNEQRTDINLIYSKSILFFVIISSVLILTCAMSFVLLQNQFQIAKLQIFRLFGARNKDIVNIFILTNLFLIGPSYIFAIVIFILAGLFWLTTVALIVSFLISLIQFTVILVLMTVPSMSLTAK